MKRIITVFLLAAICNIHSFAGDVNYYNKTWAEIKAKAKAEHKYIFIDCYTDWCGWCKVMDKETMVDPKIISFINEKFVAVKMDMEHGEGLTMSMKYHITGFPTFVFFSPEGEYVYNTVGYRKTEEFMKELHNALDKNSQFKAPGFSSKLDVDYPAIYKQAFAENGKRKFPKPEEVTAYLDKQKDLFSEVNWAVMARFELNEKYCKHFLDNVAKYEKLYGPAEVNDKVLDILYSRMKAAAKAKDGTKFAEVLSLVDKYVKADAEDTKLNFRLDYYRQTKEWGKFGEAMDEMIKKRGYENPESINSLCWNIYQDCDDKQMLQKACGYMKNVVTNAPNYPSMDTYAALLYKTCNKADAAKWANKAIEQGKKDGENVKGTEELLEKIKAN